MWFIMTSVRLIPVFEHVHLFSERVQKYIAKAGPSQRKNLNTFNYAEGGRRAETFFPAIRRTMEEAEAKLGVGSGEWGVGWESKFLVPAPHSPLPTPFSL